MNRLPLLIDRLQTARTWTQNLLADIEETRWFDMPAPGAGHVAWQVGHLAASQIALIPIRCFDRPHTDFAPESFRAIFGRTSTPVADREAYPSIVAIRADFARIHNECIRLLESMDEKELERPTPGPPHPMFATKEGAIGTAIMHESFHAGQIALIRRIMGKAPLR